MNELGEMGRSSLVLEAMSRHSNLILLRRRRAHYRLHAAGGF